MEKDIGKAAAWLTPRNRGYIAEVSETSINGTFAGWIRLQDDESVLVHFHSTCFAFKYEDELYALNHDGMLLNILVSFFVDMHVLCSKAKACAVSIMPEPEIWHRRCNEERAGKQVTLSHKWYYVKTLKDQEEITIQHKMEAKKEETNEEAKKEETNDSKSDVIWCYPEDRPKIVRERMIARATLQAKWGGPPLVLDHLAWTRPLVWGPCRGQAGSGG